MFKATCVLSSVLSALVIAGATLAFDPSPAAAQTASNLKCKGCVNSRKIRNNGIKSKDIRDGQVMNGDLGTDAVTGGKIADGSVGDADLAAGAVTSDKLAAGAVTSDKLAAGAVTSDKLGSDVTALGLTGVAVIGPGAFHGQKGNDFDDWLFNSGGFVQGDSLVTFGCIAAPADLPDGVTITEMELVFQDDSTVDFDARLSRVSLVDGSFTQMARVSTSGINDNMFRSLSETTIVEPVVDAVDFAYFVWTGSCLFDRDHRLYAVRIYYN